MLFLTLFLFCQLSDPLTTDEILFLNKFGDTSLSTYRTINTSLYNETKEFYKHHMDATLEGIKKNRILNKGKVGPLETTESSNKAVFRVILIDHQFDKIYGATSVVSDFGKQMGRKPMMFVSTFSPDIYHTLRHELRHGAVPCQSPMQFESIKLVRRVPGLDPKYNHHFFSPREIDVRLADIKAHYVKYVDKPVLTLEDAKQCWEWARLNHHKIAYLMYSYTSNEEWMKAMDENCAFGFNITFDNLYRRMLEVL